MTYRDALHQLTHRIALARDSEIAAASICLRDGAGWLASEGVPTAPAGFTPERRWIWLACSEALEFGCDGDWTIDYEPTRCGPWESVLAGCVITGDWQAILDAARGVEERSVKP